MNRSGALRTRRRVAVPALGLWLLLAIAGPVALPSMVASAIAADPPSLTVVSTARYDVQPTQGRVRVTVNLTATNHRKDTVIRSYFFDHVVLGFLPDATRFTVAPPTGSAAHPTAQVTSRTADRTLVSVAFGSKLRSGKSVTLKLTFDLVDTGSAPDRAIRIGSAIATFPVWAVGTPDTPGSKVSVRVPADFRIEVLGSRLAGPTKGPNGSQAFTSVALSAPAVFGAYVLADRPGAYRSTPVSVTVAGAPYPVVVRSWQDDAAFGTRVAGILRRALPALGKLVGVAPGARGVDGAPLSVEEAVTRSAGGYAALYDGAAGRIQVAYDAAAAVVLHEAAHAWFNGGLVADRWAVEGFASYYARQAAGPLKIKIAALPLTPALLAKRIPLNAWAADAASDTPPDPAIDAYGYAASLDLARRIAGRVSPAGLTAVWKAVRAGEMADQPAGAVAGAAPDTDPAGAAVPDWRALLDLFETRTGTDLTDLWRTWVVRPEEAALLDKRTEVRAAYRSLVEQAGDWALPRSIRVALDRWQFDTAAELIAKARAILVARPALETAATGIGVRLPPTLRAAFESDAPPDAAATELAAEQAAVERLSAAIDTRPVAPTPVERIGLIGADPEADIAAARAAFSAGDLNGAVAAADRSATTWVDALDIGRGRLAVAAGILAAFAALVLLVTATRDRRSRARWSYRAGQVIRSMGPGSGPRSRPAPEPVRGVPASRGALREVGPRSMAAAGSPGVHVTTRNLSHISAASVPMAHRIEAEPGSVAWPRNVGAPRVAAQAGAVPPSSPQPRIVAAPRGGYGTLAADHPTDRSPVTLNGRPASGPRPDAGPRSGAIPPDPVPGDE